MKPFKHIFPGSGRVAAQLCSLILLCALSGCTSPRLEHAIRDKPIGPGYTPQNVFSVGELPADFRRVLLLPPTDPAGDPLSEELTRALLASLRQASRFEIIPSGEAYGAISDLTGEAPLISKKPVSAAVLEEAGRLGADGILELHLTHYRPYKPLQIGLRGRLVSLADEGQVLWEIDELFDAGHKRVAIGARRYAETHIEQPFPLQSSYSVLMSPLRFAGYVGQMAFETLPAQ